MHYYIDKTLGAVKDILTFVAYAILGFITAPIFLMVYLLVLLFYIIVAIAPFVVIIYIIHLFIH